MKVVLQGPTFAVDLAWGCKPEHLRELMFATRHLGSAPFGAFVRRLVPAEGETFPGWLDAEIEGLTKKQDIQ